MTLMQKHLEKGSHSVKGMPWFGTRLVVLQ
ncbi:hypothetical protein PDESU_04609 [Pontiella desulfatans]|uniref:Uncharacterized protein n=1 Tax=Pontiella desulfatans TaxID=2750659 RepID=A0A6C2U819_PONDE|nr:hypothetical protein PDESU_04609 [Pontiella desulfatans]